MEDRTLSRALRSAEATRSERIFEAAQKRDTWFARENKRLEDSRSGRSGSETQHKKRLQDAANKINAWFKRQTDKIEASYQSKLERAKEKAEERAQRAKKKAASRAERRPVERRLTERRHTERTERTPTERLRSEESEESEEPARPRAEAEYKAVRRAIAQHCRGAKGALSPRAAECLKDIFYSSARRHRLHRWAKGQAANICDLTEKDYERLRGQRALPVDSRGVVGEPLPGADCGSLKVSGAATPSPATWLQWGADAMQMAAATTSVPFHVAKLARQPLSLPLAVIRRANPLMFVPLPPGLTTAAQFAGNLALRHVLMRLPITGATLLAMDGLYLFTASLPRYDVRENCMDWSGLHPVPARYVLAGGFLSSIIASLMFGGLMAMTAGQTGLTVPHFTDSVSGAWEHVSKKEGLGKLSVGLALGAAMAAGRAVGGHHIVSALSETLRNVVYGALFKLKESGWFTDSRLANMLGSIVHTLTRGYSGSELKLIMELLSEVAPDGPRTAAGALDAVGDIGDPGVANLDGVRYIKHFINDASDQLARLVMSGGVEEAAKGAAEKASKEAGAGARAGLRKMFEGIEEHGPRQNPIKAAQDTIETVTELWTRFQMLFTYEGAAAEVANISNALPPYFAGGVFASAFIALKEELDCKAAQGLYEIDQRHRHTKWLPKDKA